MTQTYPEMTIQNWLVDTWWVEESSRGLQRGRLIKAFVPHVDQIPRQIMPVGRTNSTDHTHANYEIKPLRISEPPSLSALPVAALPAYSGEANLVCRAKKRYGILVSVGGPIVEKHLTLGKPKWQTAPTILVAPCYGVEEGANRAGFNPQFVERVQRCEYPQFIWDILPVDKSGQGSILRLDHCQPIGRHHESIEILPYCLSEDALIIFDEWIAWLITGRISADSLLGLYRENFKPPEIGQWS